MEHEAVAARIEIGAADHHHAVQQVEHAVQMSSSSSSGGITTGNASDLDQGVEVAGTQVAEGRGILRRSSIVGVHPNQRFACISHSSLRHRTLLCLIQ